MSRILAVAVLALAAPRAHADTVTDFHRDRMRALDAVATVDTDARVLRVQVSRVVALRTAWNTAVAGDHPNEAGRWAIAHWAALQDQRAARQQLAFARENLHVAHQRLMADEFVMQHPTGRG